MPPRFARLGRILLNNDDANVRWDKPGETGRRRDGRGREESRCETPRAEWIHHSRGRVSDASQTWGPEYQGDAWINRWTRASVNGGFLTRCPVGGGEGEEMHLLCSLSPDTQTVGCVRVEEDHGPEATIDGSAGQNMGIKNKKKKGRRRRRRRKKKRASCVPQPWGWPVV